MPVSDGLAVHHEYEQLKFSYTTLREKWSLDELIFVCVQEKYTE